MTFLKVEKGFHIHTWSKTIAEGTGPSSAMEIVHAASYTQALSIRGRWLNQGAGGTRGPGEGQETGSSRSIPVGPTGKRRKWTEAATREVIFDIRRCRGRAGTGKGQATWLSAKVPSVYEPGKTSTKSEILVSR